MSNDRFAFKLRLLTSVDLIGSTAFKNRTDDDRGLPGWPQHFREFFRDFPEMLEANYETPAKDLEPPGQRLTTWKFVGDEILSAVVLERFTDALGHILVLKNTLADYQEQIRQKPEGLGLKATAWLAGFPVTNAEIDVRLGSGAQLVDYVGPQVDLGFRLCQLATWRCMPVSVDLAMMLLDAIHHCETDQCQLFLEGRRVLRGLPDGASYPWVWVDLLDGQRTIEEEAMGVHRETNHDALKRFVAQYIEQTARQRRPFIPGDADKRYGEIPLELEQARLQIASEETERGYDTETPPEDTADSGPAS